jgi:phosphonate transport system substrate-binding protein
MAPLVICQNIEDMTANLMNGRVDAVIEGVFPAIHISGRNKLLQPELLAWRKGQREYHSVFFVRADSPVQKLDDLRGRVVAFEAFRSSSAFMLPRLELQKIGMSVIPLDTGKKDKKAVHYVLAGSELNQAYWVERGQADAGAFNNGDWAKLPDHLKKQLRIIHETSPIPRWLLSYRTKLDTTMREIVSSELMRMHENKATASALSSALITRFERLTEADRNAISRLEAAESVNLQ